MSELAGEMMMRRKRQRGTKTVRMSKKLGRGKGRIEDEKSQKSRWVYEYDYTRRDISRAAARAFELRGGRLARKACMTVGTHTATNTTSFRFGMEGV
jgi:hypothetical protein